MSSNINKAHYLRTTRNFPATDLNAMSIQMNKAYLEIADAVNKRTYGVFTKNKPVIGGESWFIINQKQQNLRQFYTFTSDDLTFPHQLRNFGSIEYFTRIFGTFTDGTYWYPLPYVDVSDATNQINVIVESTNIVIDIGGGSPPSLTYGLVVLEWLSGIDNRENS